MKKFILLIIPILFFFLSINSVSAQMMGEDMTNFDEDIEQSEEHETLDKLMPEILEKYNTNSIQGLDCDDISDEDFERIGDGVMESVHAGAAHEQMDEMMGGEGSDSLRVAHINMGKNYLGCFNNNLRLNMPMMWMMGSDSSQAGGGVRNMMGWGYNGSMMGASGFGIFGAIVGVVVFIDLVLLGIWLWKQINKK